jgi:putative Mg2+ transporter-C (MgtC) family protein
MLLNMNFLYMVPQFLLIKVLFASLLGALIGVERDMHGRSAGLRTNLLVSLGAAVFMILSQSLPSAYLGGHDSTSILRSDPSRIAANVITGIGFLGAGVIIKSGFSVKGLTTAACLWISASIGMSSGAGYYELAIIVTAIGLFSLIFLNKLERVYAKDTYRSLQVITSTDIDLSRLISLVKRGGLKIMYCDNEINYETGKMKVIFTVRLHYREATDIMAHAIVRDIYGSGIPVYIIKWWHQ